MSFFNPDPGSIIFEDLSQGLRSSTLQVQLLGRAPVLQSPLRWGTKTNLTSP
jgi:hypothetical protein